MKRVSIVVPNFNGKDLLKKNLPSVISSCKNAEIIIVDDASTDGSQKYLKNQIIKLKAKNKKLRIKAIYNKKNLRFGSSCNKGIKAARGEIVVLLNNDVIPTNNFLPPLLSHFKDKKVFSVGCREIEIKNGKEIISGRNEAYFKRGFLVHQRAKDQNKKSTFWTFGGSMAVDKKKFLSLGGFDPLFKPAYWEDIDLSYRARLKGWKIIFEPKAVVYHQHETTNIKELGRIKMQIASYQNQLLFVWKNIKGKQLLQHFLWLPYHLIFTTIRSKGLFLIGFIKALFRLKNLIRSVKIYKVSIK